MKKPLLPLKAAYLITIPVAWFFLILLLVGCGKPPMAVTKYIMEYPAPVSGSPPRLADSIQVEQFAVAQVFNTTDMVYRPDPYRSQAYAYNRWRVNPGYMVTDSLIRDLTQSGLFQGVFPGSSGGNARFKVEGAVEEFQEIDEPDGWTAALAVSVTLLDTTAENALEKVVFQKSYRVVEPLAAKTPAGLAQGMSRAMEQASARIVRDLYEGCRKRVSSEQ